MRFRDASALVPLLIEEPATGALFDLARADPQMLVWWGSVVECASAIARMERDEELSPAAAADSLPLAAAFVAAERRPPSLEFVCLDRRRSTAAEREGFRIVSV